LLDVDWPVDHDDVVDDVLTNGQGFVYKARIHWSKYSSGFPISCSATAPI